MISKFVAASCIHAPFQDEEGREWLCSTIAEVKPTHIIILGDVFDAAAASVHGDEVSHSLEDEFESAAGYLNSLREAGPEAKCVWIHGNHDDNIKRKDPRRIPADLRSLCDWNHHNEFGKEFRRWKQRPYVKGKRGCYQLGQVIFYHGFDISVNSDQDEGLQMNYACGAHPWRLTVRGHTHRPVDVTQARRTSKVLLPNYHCNVGSIGLGNSQPDYMLRKDTSLWGRAACVGEVKMGRVNRKLGKEWEAEIRRMP